MGCVTITCVNNSEHSHHPKRRLSPQYHKSPFLSSLHALETANVLCPYGCFISIESYTMWPSVSGFKVHPRGSKCQGFTPLYGARTWRCVNEHFVSPFASRWAFGLFPLSAAVNNTPLSICVPSLGTDMHFLFSRAEV